MQIISPPVQINSTAISDWFQWPVRINSHRRFRQIPPPGSDTSTAASDEFQSPVQINSRRQIQAETAFSSQVPRALQSCCGAAMAACSIQPLRTGMSARTSPSPCTEPSVTACVDHGGRRITTGKPVIQLKQLPYRSPSEVLCISMKLWRIGNDESARRFRQLARLKASIQMRQLAAEVRKPANDR